MADGTGIEWTDATWNPTVGCTKVSPGCDNCYAETFVNRFAGSKGFPLPFDQMLLRDGRFLHLPLTWRKPRKVFVNSLSDLFHADVPDDFVARVFAVMAAAPQHTFQLLTKRHARMRSLLSDARFRRTVESLAAEIATGQPAEQAGFAWPLRNVWLGVSVEDQQWADIRIPALLDTPAAVRWISAEPLLGPVSLRWAKWQPLSETGTTDHLDGARRLGWVVVGGESGAGARPMSAEWARSLRDECAEAGVPFLFKQWGSHDEHGQPMPKKRTGRTLDGRLHDGYPVSAREERSDPATSARLGARPATTRPAEAPSGPATARTGEAAPGRLLP